MSEWCYQIGDNYCIYRALRACYEAMHVISVCKILGQNLNMSHCIANVWVTECPFFGCQQARKLQDAQAEKLTSLQANKLTT